MVLLCLRELIAGLFLDRDHPIVRALDCAEDLIQLGLNGRPSRFCAAWMTNTMLKVRIVVPVLITSCRVSLNLKSGPVSAHTRTIRTEPITAAGLPAQTVTARVIRSNI
jgi:hypothetical protein